MKPALLIAFATLAVTPAAHASSPSLQTRIDRSRSGETIHLGRGTFAGPIKIDHSIKLVGAGAGATVIRGGGPVVRITSPGARPDVLIQGVTVTGGVTSASDHCGAECGDQYVAATALGGGISIAPTAGNGIGATVTIRDAVISGNRVAPATTVSSVRAPCPGGPCRFALAAGGGIDNWGTLTLLRTRVTGNQAGGPLNSDASGGGIYSGAGSLTVEHSVIGDNRASSVAPYGRFAEGGGIFVAAGSLTVRGSLVDGNAATLTSTLPVFAGETLIEMNANSGGIHVGDRIPTTIDATAITNNTVSASDPVGAPVSFDSAMLIGHSPGTVSNTLIHGNRSFGLAKDTTETGPGGSALELNGGGTITRTTISHNTSVQRATQGRAAVNGAVAILDFSGDPTLVTMTDSLVADNRAMSATSTGDAIVQGGGIFNGSLLTLRRVVVRDNTAHADGPSGRAEGGGIWNGDELSGPPVELTLDHALVTRNRLTGGPGITLKGGGLFSTYPVTRTATTIADNSPDDQP